MFEFPELTPSFFKVHGVKLTLDPTETNSISLENMQLKITSFSRNFFVFHLTHSFF